MKPGRFKLDVLPPKSQSLDTVRDQNLKLLKEMAPLARLILMKRLGADAEAVRFWRDPDGLEGRLAGLANAGGWIDFDLLDEAAMLGWLVQSAHWPVGLANSRRHADVVMQPPVPCADLDALIAAARDRKEPSDP